MKEERLLKVVLGPHVSEKSSLVADKVRQIVFKVKRDSTKREIKDAIEKLFEVKVKKVQTVNYLGKTKKRGDVQGRRNHWKKAYVCLEDGYDIDFASGTA